MSGQHIIMNFSVPPSPDDLLVIVHDVLETLPHELSDYTDDLVVEIEEFPDAVIEQELDLEDPYDLCALFRSGNEITPGVEKKSSKDDDRLIIYRRPVLDLWCDTGFDIFAVTRQVIIEELGRHFNFSDDEIEDLVSRHHQGML